MREEIAKQFWSILFVDKITAYFNRIYISYTTSHTRFPFVFSSFESGGIFTVAGVGHETIRANLHESTPPY